MLLVLPFFNLLLWHWPFCTLWLFPQTIKHIRLLLDPLCSSTTTTVVNIVKTKCHYRSSYSQSHIIQGIESFFYLQPIYDNIMDAVVKMKRESSPQRVPNSSSGSSNNDLTTGILGTSPVVRAGSWKVLSSQHYEGKKWSSNNNLMFFF